jgi:tRNA (guanine37-N1)-methyltransferase
MKLDYSQIMKITIITLFPELFDGFLHCSKMDRAIVDGYIEVDFINPRDFCTDRHQQVDDEIYGGNTGLLIKAQPVIEAVEKAIQEGEKWLKSGWKVVEGGNFKNRFAIIYPSPSQTVFNQTHATGWGQDYDHLIFVCWRYEGIDHRFDLYMQDRYPEQFKRISLWQFVVFGGEAPSMVMMEAVVRLLPGVITHFPHEESYDVSQELSNLEYPQYTRPQEVYGYTVPEVLLSGHHKNIQKWNEENSQSIIDK